MHLVKSLQNKDGAAGIQPYQGRMIFCDAALGCIHIKHQVAPTSYKMIASKINFRHNWTMHDYRTYMSRALQPMSWNQSKLP